jgi:hypothetical protein
VPLRRGADGKLGIAGSGKILGDQRDASSPQPRGNTNPDLVPMQKDGTVLNVHQNGVAEHEQLGWRRVDVDG